MMIFKNPKRIRIFKDYLKFKKEDNRAQRLSEASIIVGLLLKVGAFCVAIGVSLCVFYLKNIGFGSLISSFIASGVGEESFLFGLGLGLFFPLLIALLLIFPVIVLLVKVMLLGDIGQSSVGIEKWFSARYIFIISFLFPILFIFGSFFVNDHYFDFLFAFELMAFCLYFVYKSWRSVSFTQCFIYCILLMMIMLATLFPWMFFLKSIAASKLIENNSSFFQYWLVFIFGMLYALSSAFIVDKVDVRKVFDIGSNIKAPIFSMSGMVVFMVFISPSIFLDGVMNFAGIRQNINEVEWYYVSESEYSRLPLNFGVNGFKESGGNKYYCGFSVFNFGEHNVLCPFDVKNINAKTCIAFAAKNVSIVPAPQSDEWSCKPLMRNET